MDRATGRARIAAFTNRKKSQGNRQCQALWSAGKTAVEALENRLLLSISPVLLPGPPADANNAVPFLNKLYYTGTSGGAYGLWSSGATAATTGQVLPLPATAAALTPAGSNLFFTDTSNAGNLWVSDGTAGGTHVITSFNPTHSNTATGPFNLAAVGNTLFFDAKDATHGIELWKSDGTAGGTVMVADINPSGDSYPIALTNDAGKLFFYANDGTHGDEPWISDGTSTGTSMFADIDPGSDSSFPGAPDGSTPAFASVNGTVFFSATTDRINNQLWESGPGGTGPLGSSMGGSLPKTVTVINGSPTRVLYIDPNANKLYVTDGTNAGTSPILSFAAGTTLPAQISTSAGVGYFRTSSSGGPYTLWITNGTTAGTTVIETLPNSTANGQIITTSAAVQGDLYFSNFDATGHYQLWQSDGTAGGTVQLTSFTSTAGAFQPQNFAVVNNSLFFNAADGTHPNGLWVLPPLPNTAPAAPSNLTAQTISALRVDLKWQDNSANSAKFLVERSLTSDFSAIDQSYSLPIGTTSLNDTLTVPNSFYYYRVSAFTNFGTSSPVTTVASTPALTYAPGITQVDSSSDWFNVQIVTTWRNNVVFTALSNTYGLTLARSEGSIITPLLQLTQANVGVTSNTGNALFFDADGQHWKSDGTMAGTVPVGSPSAQPAATTLPPTAYETVSFYGSTYFLGLFGDNSGYGLFNGTDPSHPVLITQIQPLSTRYQPRELTVANGQMFFEDGSSLWTSDGTAAGTVRLKTFGVYNFPTVADLTVIAGRLFFTSHVALGSDNNGTNLFDGELWTSDGTAGGTVSIAGLPDTLNVLETSPGQLTQLNGTIFFSADVGSYKQALNGKLLHYTPPPFTPIKAADPSNAIASAFSAGEVDLTWSDNANNEEGYRIERSTSPSFSTIAFTTTVVPDTSAFVDLGVAPGQTYYYRITGFNDGGSTASIVSNPVITPVGPVAPTNLTAANTIPGTQVNLAWTDHDPAATGYAIQRASNALFYPASSIDMTAILPAGATAYSDTTVSRLTTYYYRVFAIDAAGNSAAAVTSISTPESAPLAPTNLQAVGAGATEIDLLWVNHAVNADPATGYRVERAGVDGVFSEIAQLPSTASNYSDLNLAAEGIYSYRVRAINSVGPSAYAGPVTSQTLPPQLITPVTVLPTVGSVTAPANTDASPVYTANGVGYFVGTDSNQGRGLFRIDSPGAAPVFVKKMSIDIIPANGLGMVGIGNAIYFFAGDGSGNISLWKSDGTASGTVPVSFIYNFGGTDNIHSFMSVGTTMYFTTGTSSPHLLFRSDGTAAGTYQLFDTSGQFGPASVANVGGTLYFTSGTALYSTDGTAANTTFIQSLGGTNFTAAAPNKFFFFTANTQGSITLWFTDTVNPPVQLMFLGNSFPTGSLIGTYNGSLYFNANGTTYRSDGTPAGTVPVTPPSSIWNGRAYNFFTMNGKLLFITDRLVGNQSFHTLWISDGTDAGTTPLLDIARPGNQALTNLTNLNGTLYFSLIAAPTGTELWKSDLTTAGTQAVQLFAQTLSNLTAYGNKLYFGAGPQDTTLWVTDGTSAGTQTVPFVGLTFPAHPDWMTTVNGRVFFMSSAVPGGGINYDESGLELWTTDGTAVGTRKLFTGQVRTPINFSNTLFFVANDNQIWKSDGTAGGTVLVKDMLPLTSFSHLLLLGATSNYLFFAASFGSGFQLWQSDASGNASVVKQSDGTAMTVGPQTINNAQPVSVTSGGYFYFTDGQSGGGSPWGYLWRTDGTSAAVKIAGMNSYGVTEVADVNGTLFAAGGGLYAITAASPTATFLVGPAHPFDPYYVTDLTKVGNYLYYSGPSATDGLVVWRSDGTPAGTIEAADPSPNTSNSFDAAHAYNITDVNGVAYFLSADTFNSTPGPTGALWRTDGTPAGTVRIRNVNVQQNILYGPRPLFATNVGGILVYADGTNLWRSDGTTANTVQIDDVYTASDGTHSDAVFGGSPFAVLGNQIFYSAPVPGDARDLRVAYLVPPVAPTGLTTGGTSLTSSGHSASPAATVGGVHLTWIDRSNNESGFVIARSTSLTFQTLNQSFFVPANTTSFTDATASPGQYYYRVRAVNAGGFSVFSNTTAPAAVVGRYVFYNNSAWDGLNPGVNPNGGDSAAIATDKQALLPGRTATFANYTSFSNGLNGVMIDLVNPANGPAINASDFQFHVGNDNNPSSWILGTTPIAVDLPGLGVGGSDRIEMIWPDGAIQNQWVQITVLPTLHTGLASADVFYFGNAVGSAGDDPSSAAVVSADELLARSNGTGLGVAAIDNPYDYNRDKHVNSQDQLIARNNRSGLTPLQLISVPVTSTGNSPSGSGSTTVVPTVPIAQPIVRVNPAPKMTYIAPPKKAPAPPPPPKAPPAPPKTVKTPPAAPKPPAPKPLATKPATTGSSVKPTVATTTRSPGTTSSTAAETSTASPSNTTKLAAALLFSATPIVATKPAASASPPVARTAASVAPPPPAGNKKPSPAQ